MTDLSERQVLSVLLDGDCRRSPVEANFAAEMAQLAVALQHDAADESEVLALIADGAVDIIPGAEGAAIVVLAEPGRLTARSVRGDLPAPLMRLQNEIGEGPCLDAVAGTTRVLVRDVAIETRWELFIAAAVGVGVRSMLCTPLVAGSRTYGSLSLTSSRAGAFDDESEQLARVFATHAAVALSGAEFRYSIGAALESRDLIGQAKGILMERYGVSPQVAFAILVKVSQNSNVKLREVCAQLCRDGGLPVPIREDWITLG